MHPLDLFHPAVASWFETRFGSPTEPEARAWPEDPLLYVHNTPGFGLLGLILVAALVVLRRRQTH